MARKDGNQDSEPVVTKEVALSNPQVSNSINLNMNQNDVIDIAIQEQLGILELEMKRVETLQKEKLKEYQDTQSSLLDDFAKKFALKNKGYQKFSELVEAGKLKVKRKMANDDSDVDYDENDQLIVPAGFAYASNYTSKYVASYKDYNFNDQYRDYKHPVQHAKRNVRDSNIELKIPKEIQLNIQASDDHGFTMSWASGEMPTTVEFRQAFERKMTPLAKELATLLTQVYDLNLKYLEYEHGDKKIKALVLKKSLSKSEEGRGILKMLQDATNIKMLS